ncbi:MAG TPA: D-glycero-beta-D-manno-heptose 1-phosphate adenylyltransferase [Candidatus Limnocylindrales bacterium]|nr:D-glycero-beta-D-manno-heptose 1-phosphate adenylyltransferase [Candidatus Limnocylindrales bacterium]
MGEILTLEEAKRRRMAARVLGRKFVFTNGCFDLIHPGHTELLRRARSLGHYLLVGLNSDRSVRAIKGADRPVQGEQARATVMAALASVDYVVIFDEDTPIRLIEELLPDVLVKGGDYAPASVVGKAEVERAGGHVHVIPLMPGFSSSEIAQRIRQT